MARLLRFRSAQEVSTPNARVGERLLQMGSITPDHLRIALHEQRRTHERLGAILVQLGFLDEETLAEVLAERSGYASIDLKQAVLDPALVERVPKALAVKHNMIPLGLENGRLEVALADPYDIVALDEMRRHFPDASELVPRVAPAVDIAAMLELYGEASDSFDEILQELETGRATAPQGRDWEHPVVRLVNSIVTEGVRRGASDIHLEPESRFIRLRYRIDGVLHQERILHLAHWPEVSHRIKIMAGMNIADQRSMQDGRFTLTVGGATIDFRVAVMPTACGENIVIRILDHRRAMLPLEKLGFNATALAAIERLLQRPEGIILVTGPTGCGKTTTLYSMLHKISSVDVNIMTLEEPIEYRLALIRQTAVREEQGIGFAEGVRGILRQDPDVIFIGEVRDAATAQMALRSAMTGHQVFSTLHCNDALGALPRLIDLGLHPRMMAGHVVGVIAQRLVRKLCPHCKTMRLATEEESRLLRCAKQQNDATMKFLPDVGHFAEAQSPYDAPVAAVPVPMIGEAVGCDSCTGTGYRGRTVVAEVLRVTPELDALVAEDASRVRLRKQMLADGFQSMAEDGIAKVLSGEISLDSLRRAVDMTRGI